MNYLYAEAARQRRRWYAQHPEARRRLSRPVISVGNLTIGGTGKTPAVRHIAELLLALGERPAILSRGYGREDPADGVVVVRDAQRLHADVARGGDEPLMLARSLGGVSVLVSSDRYLAGRLAERRLGCSVHLLDDGFQHLVLERDIDILLVDPRDLEAQPLPLGRLREPLDAAAFVHALILTNGLDADAQGLADRFGVLRAFTLKRTLGAPRLVEPFGQPLAVTPGARVVAVAATARPERFFTDVKTLGYELADALPFRDHHPFSRRDVDGIAQAARAAHAELILTTEKDLMRLLRHRPLPATVAWVPLAVTIEPPDEFRRWLTERLESAKDARRWPD